jgi:hypothetical protein
VSFLLLRVAFLPRRVSFLPRARNDCLPSCRRDAVLASGEGGKSQSSLTGFFPEEEADSLRGSRLPRVLDCRSGWPLERVLEQVVNQVQGHPGV